VERAERLVRVSDEGVAGDYRQAVVDATAEIDGETLESVVTQVDDFDGTSRSSVQRLISDTGSDGIRLIDEVGSDTAARAARQYDEIDSSAQASVQNLLGGSGAVNGDDVLQILRRVEENNDASSYSRRRHLREVSGSTLAFVRTHQTGNSQGACSQAR